MITSSQLSRLPQLARWLEGQPRVRRILHPAFDSCPGHAVFRRDFAGASGLFAVVLAVWDRRTMGRVHPVTLWVGLDPR